MFALIEEGGDDAEAFVQYGAKVSLRCAQEAYGLPVISDSAVAALNLDAQFLANGADGAELRARPLWQNPDMGGLDKNWHLLSQHVLKLGNPWGNRVKWYEGVLRGG